jgi:O-antigen biosynthesis protein
MGKFLTVDGAKLYVRGVTYGTFRENADGEPFPARGTVDFDFAMMAEHGLNTLRTYTVPPLWLLDAAADRGLYVLVGIPWEQHVAFLEDRARPRSIVRRVREGVQRCAGHPAILAYAVGNEIPAPIVRWHGRLRIERFLRRLYEATKTEDPGGLITYVNFPSTEYLRLPFLDFACFNVFLEQREPFESYLARLQNLTGNRPLLMGELGLDSRSHGNRAQAQAIDWQLSTSFAAGCAGAFVFSWTDEWNRGGLDVQDWDFGLTDRARRPKPALEAAERVFENAPLPAELDCPHVSVVVCSRNGAGTLGDCLDGLLELDYPPFEVVVVDDGSTDATGELAASYPFTLVSTGGCGLAAARNAGIEASSGEIVAFIDDDARPDRDWLKYLAHAFTTSTHAAIGGPNIPPAEEGAVAECIARAPGGPVHVLLTDREAEHIPGCNMSFRRSALEQIGGFDSAFTTAGDDVDICWRLRKHGFTLGFQPAAMVWHRRRRTLGAFLRQQIGYGRAEALLERKWPERYNSAGHVSWLGRIYGGGLARSLLPGRWHVYYGTWGSAPFQPAYDTQPGRLASLTLMPELYLLIAVLAALSASTLVWPPLHLALAPLALAVAILVSQAAIGANAARFDRSGRSRLSVVGLRAMTALLHLVQPPARLVGRLRQGLRPWRQRGGVRLPLRLRRGGTTWCELWQPPEAHIAALEQRLKHEGMAVLRGGNSDRWDLEVRVGALSRVRITVAVEEHGEGHQLVRERRRPHLSGMGAVLLAVPMLLTLAAALDGAWVAVTAFGVVSSAIVVRALQECAGMMIDPNMASVPAAETRAVRNVEELPVERS